MSKRKEEKQRIKGTWRKRSSKAERFVLDGEGTAYFSGEKRAVFSGEQGTDLELSGIGENSAEGKSKSEAEYTINRANNSVERELNSEKECGEKIETEIEENIGTELEERSGVKDERNIRADIEEKTETDIEEKTETDIEEPTKKYLIVNPETEAGENTSIQRNRELSLETEKLEFASIEAYKTLRTNIQFCGKDIKTICITSSLPNEGKTEVAFQLAKTIAESGKKVLFIDADLRKSVILSRLKINKAAYGLSQYLSGMNKLDEVINKTSLENVDMIFTGPIPPNPSEMLDGDIFKELIRSQREIYDYIIIDTPPLGIVIDSANVAQACDGTILVVEANEISYKLAQKVLAQLQKGKCRVLGAVLNKVDANRKSYYGKYYGKGYGEYYTGH